MGDSLFGGGTKTTQTSTPWGPQGDALKDIFAKAGQAYASKAGTPWYEGDIYANMDPMTAAAIKQNLEYINSRGKQTADTVEGVGNKMLDGSVDGFKQAADGLYSASSTDPTQANIAAASAYANNPAIDGMIDAASRDVKRNLFENEIPGLNRAGTASGNINSSRAGVAEGIMRRGAADQVGDISAAIRGNAFDHGLSLAEGARTANMSGLGSSAGIYGQQFGQGIGALGTARDINLGNTASAIDTSSLFQKDQQGQLDANFQKWLGNDTRDMDLLSKYYGIVGSGNWGGTQTGTQKQQSSILGNVLGVASTVAAFSDRRLKENIRKLGEAEDGLGVYEFDYVWGEPSVGVMADEVAALRPWALGPTRAGFQTVNYAAL